MVFCVTVINFPSLLHAACPTQSSDGRQQELVTALVTEVKWPGVTFTPSTGKELRVFQLDNRVLRGSFISFDNRTFFFKSTCPGALQVWRQDGSNILEHETISEKQGLHYAKIEEKAFVYGSTKNNRTYRLPDRRSKREAEEEYSARIALGHVSDDKEVGDALDELTFNPDALFLMKLSQALGEFGIYGNLSPCSLTLHFTAMFISRKLSINEIQDKVDLESFDCAERRRNEGLRNSKRLRRSVMREAENSRRVKGDGGVRMSRRCYSLEKNRDDDCLAMCGRGCSCWKWVCGDCCYHQGCYEHDRCCRAKRSIKTLISCYIPVTFSCNSFPQYISCL